MTDTPKPRFTIKYLNGNTAPCEVQFTDTYQFQWDRIYRFDFGDGKLFQWDTADQIVAVHTYKTPGTYQVSAIATDRKTASPPVMVTIQGAKKKWWDLFFEWIRGLFK